MCSLRKDSEFFSYIVRIFPQLKTFSKVCLSNSAARCYYVVVVVVASYARARICELTLRKLTSRKMIFARARVNTGVCVEKSSPSWEPYMPSNCLGTLRSILHFFLTSFIFLFGLFCKWYLLREKSALKPGEKYNPGAIEFSRCDFCFLGNFQGEVGRLKCPRSNFCPNIAVLGRFGMYFF